MFLSVNVNSYFVNTCKCYLERKLSVHFGEPKTKSVLFDSKQNLKKFIEEFELNSFPK